MRSGAYISDDHKGGSSGGKEVKITLPPNYKNGTDTDYLQCLKTTNSSASVTFLGLTGSTARYWAQPNVEFVVGVKVQYNGIKPNCYNATRNYIIKVYPDVDSSDWYAGYVFDLTNKGLILGGENNGVFGFWPNDPITVAEFLIIMYRAADIGEILDPVFDENDSQTLTLGTQVRGNLSEYGGKNFKINITEPGYYYVTGSNLRLHLTDYAGKAIPMNNPNQREYRIESAHPVYLYVSGASSAAYTLSFNKREDGYVGPSLLEFTKSPDSNFIYVNNPEYITKWDIIDDEDTKRLKFIEQTATGKNTFYETHAAWWGDYPERFEPKQSFYMDVDFYNPGDTPVTVSIRNLAYGSDYPVLQSYFTGGINREITIKAKEHVLLFEYLNAPLHNCL